MKTISGIIALMLLAGCATAKPTPTAWVQNADGAWTQDAPAVATTERWWTGENCAALSGAWGRAGCWSIAVLAGMSQAYNSVDWYSLPTPK